MFRLFFRRRRAGDYGDRVLEFHGRVGRAAVLAAIAILVGRAANRAFAADIAIRQEHLFLLVVRLLNRASTNVPRIEQAPVDFRRQLLILGGMGRHIIIDADPESGEIGLVACSDLGNEFLWRDVGGLCL